MRSRRSAGSPAPAARIADCGDRGRLALAGTITDCRVTNPPRGELCDVCAPDRTLADLWPDVYTCAVCGASLDSQAQAREHEYFQEELAAEWEGEDAP
jgi:hypothetical protein